jgi:hypothetical protein
MVDLKKPAAKSVPITPVTKPVVPTNITRHSIPPLPGEKPAVETTMPATSSIEAVAPVKVVQPASAEAQPTADPAPVSKPVEKLGPKLRRKDEILKVLRVGGKVVKVDGLFRIVAADGTKNPTSKRRILSLESQKLLVASADGNSFTLDVAADKKAQEPKVVPVVKEPVKDAK